VCHIAVFFYFTLYFAFEAWQSPLRKGLLLKEETRGFIRTATEQPRHLSENQPELSV
jgi:hypothetical protein